MKELETKLGEFEGSEPGAGDAGGKKREPMTMQQKVEAELLKHVR